MMSYFQDGGIGGHDINSFPEKSAAIWRVHTASAAVPDP